MKRGFVPALGTPVDENGRLCRASYEKQIEMMLDNGAVALLSMGSMGQQAFLANDVCTEVAECAVNAAAGRVPVFVGAMDNSILRTRARMAAMEHIDLTAFVLLVPYYEIDNDDQVLKYFREVAKATSHGIIIYDLPPVTKYRVSYDLLKRIKAEVPNLIGIKSANLNMLRLVKLNPDFEGFMTFYSGLDSFDIAYPWGIGCVLDGMPTCTPKNSRLMIEAMDRGDRLAAAEALNNIIELRDLFCELDLWPAYSAAMNLLGLEGRHAPDWITPSSPEVVERVREEMVKIGEL